MTDQSPPSDPWAQQPPQGYAPQQWYPPPSYPPESHAAPTYPPAVYQPGVSPAPPPPQIGPYSPLVGRNLVANETLWSMLAHLSIFALSLIGPIIIMVTEGKKSPYTRHHAVEALNMHLTLLIIQLICFATFFLIIPLLLLLCAAITAMVFGVMAGMAANRGETYRYPMIWRMVK